MEGWRASSAQFYQRRFQHATKLSMKHPEILQHYSGRRTDYFVNSYMRTNMTLKTSPSIRANGTRTHRLRSPTDGARSLILQPRFAKATRQIPKRSREYPWSCATAAS